MKFDTGTSFQMIDLQGRIPSSQPIEWLSADLPLRTGSPLAIVNFAVEGKKQPYGLRLDLGKGVFLDRPEDPALSSAVENSTPRILEVLRSPRDSVRYRRISLKDKRRPPRLRTLHFAGD